MVQSKLNMAQFRTPLSPPVRALLTSVERGGSLWLAAALSLGLGACALPGSGPGPIAADAGTGTGSVRVICRLVDTREVDNRLALDLARAAGMPVAQLHAVGDRLVAVEFRCAPAVRCEQGLDRLRGVSPLVADLTLDGQAQAPRQPTRPQERP